MRSIFGTYSSVRLTDNGPLEQKSCVIFDRWKGQIGCYFELIAPYFDELAKRQSEVDMDALNVRVAISTEDLDSAVSICDVMLTNFAKQDEQWRFHHDRLVWVQNRTLLYGPLRSRSEASTEQQIETVFHNE